MQAGQTRARPRLRLHVQLAQDGERAAARERLACGRAVRVPGRRQRRRERPLAAAVRLRAQRAALPGGPERARIVEAAGRLLASCSCWKRLQSRLGRATQQRRHDAWRCSERRGGQARRPMWQGQGRSPCDAGQAAHHSPFLHGRQGARLCARHPVRLLQARLLQELRTGRRRAARLRAGQAAERAAAVGERAVVAALAASRGRQRLRAAQRLRRDVQVAQLRVDARQQL